MEKVGGQTSPYIPLFGGVDTELQSAKEPFEGVSTNRSFIIFLGVGGFCLGGKRIKFRIRPFSFWLFCYFEVFEIKEASGSMVCLFF